MGGIKLQLDAALIGTTNLTIVHHRPLQQPGICPECDELHTFKTYHLKPDAQGQVTVSKQVYERLAELEGLPLKKIGTDAHPQPQVLVMAPLGQEHLLEKKKKGRSERFVPRSMENAYEATRRK